MFARESMFVVVMMGAALAHFGLFLDQLADRQQELQHGRGEQGGEDRQEVGAHAHGHTDCGDQPDGRRGRHALGLVARLQESAGPQEADAADDLSGDARRVLRVALYREALDAQDSKQAGAERDEDVRAEARRTPAPLALDADDAPQKSSERDLAGAAPTEGAEYGDPFRIHSVLRWLRKINRALAQTAG